MMMKGTSPFTNKRGVKRSPNKFPKKNKIQDEETNYVSDRDESFKMTYDNENHMNFPQKSELSVKSSNTHKITSFNKNRRSDKGTLHGSPHNIQIDPRAQLNPNRAQVLKKKHLKKKS